MCWASSPWEAIQNCFCALDLTWSCCGYARASSNKHPLIRGILPKTVFFLLSLLALVLLSLGTVSLALPGNSICCLSSNPHTSDAWCTCTTAVFFVVVAATNKLLLFARLVAIIARHLSYEWLAILPCRHQGLKPFSLLSGGLFLLLCLSPATAVVAELVLLTLALLTVLIVSIIALSVRPLAPALVRKRCSLHSLRMRCGDWCPCSNNYHSRMSVIVILTMSSWCPCCVRWQGNLVALRLIATVFLVAFEGLASWALLRLTMKALVASIAIGDGFNCVHCDWPCRHCLLLLVATANSSDAHVAFAATFFTSLLN